MLLGDNKTLWAVMRVDGGDGIPSHRTLPLLSSSSTDFGRSWSRATPLPDGSSLILSLNTLLNILVHVIHVIRDNVMSATQILCCVCIFGLTD